VLDGFPVLLALQDLVDAYRDSRSALTMQREKDNIKSWPHSGSSVALPRKFFHDFFARERLTEKGTRHELDSAHQYVATRPEEYSNFVRQSAPTWVVAIHNVAPPGLLNDYETNWGRYDRQQPDNTKRHMDMKTGLQGHVHTLPSLRGIPNVWAGEPDVHGMVDKEVVRALLERRDINSLLHLFPNRAPAFQQNRPEGLTSTDLEWALHRQKLGDMVPTNALHALVMRCCFRCDNLTYGVGSHGINDCKHVPSVQDQAGLDRSSWDTRWGGAGPSGKDAFLPKQAARQQGTAPGATYVTGFLSALH